MINFGAQSRVLIRCNEKKRDANDSDTILEIKTSTPRGLLENKFVSKAKKLSSRNVSQNRRNEFTIFAFDQGCLFYFI
jgi:hypothetical protein